MSLTDFLLQFPVVQGLVIKAVADIVHGLLVEVDANGEAAKQEKWLSPLAVTLSGVATLINLAVAGHLAAFDVNQALVTLSALFLGMKAAPTAGTKALAVDVKAKLTK